MQWTPWKRQFEAFAGSVLVEHKIPGFSVGLAQNGDPVYQQGFGFRDREQGLPCTAETVHGIGSVTKAFTCVAIMQLVDRGQLAVDEPILKYIPEFKTPDPAHTEQITIHHLMTHSAGLPPMPTLMRTLKSSLLNDPAAMAGEQGEKLKELPAIDTYDELITALNELPYELLGPVGTKFSYSNDSYGLLGMIIERVSGLSYAEFVEKNILEPAGMDHSTFDLETLLRYDEVTMLYQAPPDDLDNPQRQPGWWQAPTMLAAGFLRSTVPDMLRFMEIFRNGGMVGRTRLLSEASVQAMTGCHIQCGPNQWYGYGLMITPNYGGEGVTLVEHGGNVKGVSAMASCVPERGITAVALTNGSAMPAGKLALGVINACLGLPVDTRRANLPEATCEAEALAAYAGTFISGEGSAIKVLVEEERLVLEFAGKKWPARAAGPDLFAISMRGDEAAITFMRGENGQVSHLSLGYRIIKKSA